MQDNSNIVPFTGASANENQQTPFDDFLLAMKAAKIPFTGTAADLIVDGQYHRFSTDELDESDTTGSYKLTKIKDGVIGFAFDFRTGRKCHWKTGNKNLTRSERGVFERDHTHQNIQYNEGKKQREEAVSNEVIALFETAETQVRSLYLQKKKVKAHGVRWVEDPYNSYLLMPLRDVEDTLWNVQRVYDKPFPDGKKKLFFKGGRKKGLFHLIGCTLETLTSFHRVFLAEGYSTGASVYEATGEPVVVCVDAHNVIEVCRAFKNYTRREIMEGEIIEFQPFSTIPFVLAADNDDAKKRNTGLETAITLLEEFGYPYYLPVKGADYPQSISDYNDIMVYEGAARVQELLTHCAPIQVTDEQTRLKIFEKEDIEEIDIFESKVEDTFQSNHRVLFKKHIYKTHSINANGSKNPSGGFLATQQELADAAAADMEEKWGSNNVIYADSSLQKYNGSYWETFKREEGVRDEFTRWLNLYNTASYCYRYNEEGEPVYNTIRLKGTDIEAAQAQLITRYRNEEIFREDKTGVGINCLNGFLRFDKFKWELIDHSPALGQRGVVEVCAPVDFDPETFKIPVQSKIYRFLRTCFKDLDKTAFQQMLTYFCEILGVIISRNSKKLAKPVGFFLIGEGNNGKNEFMKLLAGLLSKDKYSNITSNNLSETGGKPSPEIYKLKDSYFNFCGERADDGAISEEAFKRYITDGEDINARLLHKNPEDFPIHTLFMFGVNKLPYFKGGITPSIKRRLRLIAFNCPITDEDIEPDVSGKILETEKDLLLKMALWGLENVRRHGTYINPPFCQKFLEEQILHSDSRRDWINERICFDRQYTEKIPLTKLAESYERFCRENGCHYNEKIKGKVLSSFLIEVGGKQTVVRVNGAQNVYCLTGLKIGFKETQNNSRAEATSTDNHRLVTVEDETDSSSTPVVFSPPISLMHQEERQEERAAKNHSTQEEGLQPALDEPAICYTFIETLEEAKADLRKLIEQGELVGLDLETTGLYPHEGHKARLLQITTLDENRVVVIDLFKVGGLEALKEELSQIKAVAHNAVFEMKFLKAAGIHVVFDCSMIACHLVRGREKGESLEALILENFAVKLDKTYQKLNWGTIETFTHDQLLYAAKDAYWTKRLFTEAWQHIESDQLEIVYKTVRAAQVGIVDMENTGVFFDTTQHAGLIEDWKQEKDRLLVDMSKIIPFNEGALNKILAKKTTKGLLAEMDPVQKEAYVQQQRNLILEKSLNSSAYMGQWIRTLLGGETSEGYLKFPKTDKTETLSIKEGDIRIGFPYFSIEMQHFFTDLFFPYKEKTKLLSTYGEKLAQRVSRQTGRLHGSFHLCGTITGRLSSSNPNMQNIPRDKTVRSLFRAEEEKALISADYSQIELRVAALVAQEEKMLAAYEQEEDLHKLTASWIINKPLCEVTKQDRQLAKAVNFGLLYGQSAKGLQIYAASSYGVNLTLEEAELYRENWLSTYSGISNWHKTAHNWKHLAIKTPSGRIRRFDHRVKVGGLSEQFDRSRHYKPTFAYNTPVQGGAAEVSLTAMGLLISRLEPYNAHLVGAIHDEFIVECSIEKAEDVKTVVEECMIQGMLSVFPEACIKGLVEANIVQSWADK